LRLARAIAERRFADANDLGKHQEVLELEAQRLLQEDNGGG
jgi:hypothetical protein